MASQAKDAAPFPMRFELRYSQDEALRNYERTLQRQMSLVGSRRALGHLVMVTVAVGLPFLGLAAGALPASAVPPMGLLIGLAFMGGEYMASIENRGTMKRIVKALHEQSAEFGPWDVTVTERTLVASRDGRASRLDLAAIRSVSLDATFVVLTIDPGLDFAVPRRCFGEDRTVEAFKGFIEAQRARSAPSATP
jgi:hypothetical protein